MYASKFGCKITQFSPRARADIRDKCGKIDTLIGFVGLKWSRNYCL